MGELARIAYTVASTYKNREQVTSKVDAAQIDAIVSKLYKIIESKDFTKADGLEWMNLVRHTGKIQNINKNKFKNMLLSEKSIDQLQDMIL